MEFLQKINDLQIVGFSDGHNELTEKMLCLQDEGLINNSDTIFFDQFAPSCDIIKFALRRQTNLYFSKFPSLKELELKQLIKLENEARSVVQFFLPPIFHAENFQNLRQLKSPFLANIRASSTTGETDLFPILLFFVYLVNSEFRKADLMTVPAPNGTTLFETRITFTSGSVFRFLISNHIMNEESGIEIFQPGKPIICCNYTNFSEEQLIAAEEIAIDQFLNAIRGQNSVVIRFSHLLQAQQIHQNLRTKMYYSSIFPESEKHAV